MYKMLHLYRNDCSFIEFIYKKSILERKIGIVLVFYSVCGIYIIYTCQICMGFAMETLYYKMRMTRLSFVSTHRWQCQWFVIRASLRIQFLFVKQSDYSVLKTLCFQIENGHRNLNNCPVLSFPEVL